MAPRPHPAAAAPGALAPLDDGLIRDPRFVCNARLLASLHTELRRRLGAPAAEAALLQAGFFHGLRDALRAGADARPRWDAESAERRLAAPLIPLQLASEPDAAGPRLRGSWPRATEADAIRSARGRPKGPACLVSAGYTSGWLTGLSGADTLAIERECAAAGGAGCCFEAREAAAWRAGGEPEALRRLADLPFASLRLAVARDLPDPDDEAEGAFDPSSPAVHVWGPVMVLPYAGETTAASFEAVVREPGAAQVSVVVIDLDGVVIDEGFGAVALEHVIDGIRAWGAEPVLASVSPLSARAIESLAGEPIVVPKDLCAAIAAAFQIAEAQRRTS